MKKYEERLETLSLLVNEAYQKEVEHTFKCNNLDVDKVNRGEYTEDEYYLKTAIEEWKYDDYASLYNYVKGELDIIEINYIAYQHTENEDIKALCDRNINDAISEIQDICMTYDYILFDKNIMNLRRFTEQEIEEFKEQRIREIEEEQKRLEELETITKELIENDEIPF